MGGLLERKGWESLHVRSKSHQLELYFVIGVHTFSMRGINRESKPGHCSLGMSVAATQSPGCIELTSPSTDHLQVSARPHHQCRDPLLVVAT